MDIKKLLIRSAIWAVVCFGLGLVGVGYITSHPTPGKSTDAQSKDLGQVVSVVIMIGWGVIWLPEAIRVGQKRQKQRSRRR